MEAALHLAGEASMRLLAQIVEVYFVDQAAHATDELARAGLAVIAVGDADDADAAVLQAPHDALLFDLVAREAIETFEDQHGELACDRSLEQLAATHALGNWRRTGNRLVGEDPRHVELQRLSSSSADPRLILERA